MRARGRRHRSATGGNIARRVIAVACFVVATAYSWWRSARERDADATTDDADRARSTRGRGALRRPLAIRAPRGTELNARSWSTEAPLRMLLNNLDREVAEQPEALVVYGGSGRAARSHDALKAIVRHAAPPRRRRDAARPERQARRGLPDASGRAARPDRERACSCRAGRPGTSSAGSRRSG